MSTTKRGVRGVPEPAEKPLRRMSRDLRRSREQRQRILEAASEIMARDPSEAVTLDDIASKMGSSKGIIYYYFKSKGEMLYHLRMYAYDLFEEAVYPIMDDASIPPKDRLERTIRAHIMVICDNWQLWRSLWRDVAIPQEFTRVLSRRRTKYERKMTELIEEVMAAEGWTCLEPKTVTRIITGLVNSISRWYKKSGRFSAEEVADLAVKCALYGPFDRG